MNGMFAGLDYHLLQLFEAAIAASSASLDCNMLLADLQAGHLSDASIFS
jgi:hypothetical protein